MVTLNDYARTNNPKGLKHFPQVPNIKRAYVNEQIESWEAEEYIKCQRDIFYFIENYVIINGDQGVGRFKLYDYQKNLINKLLDEKFVITLASRQIGKSETYGVFILWFALFHSNKNCFILSKTDKDSISNLQKLQSNLERIPFFLQPGVKQYSVKKIEFENGTTIQTGSSKGIRGNTADIIYCDEFAFLQDSKAFWTATYPTITSKKITNKFTGKVFISSTPNGIGDTFHTLWSNATQGKNEFIPVRWYWYDKPRDEQEKWKKDTISAVGQFSWQSDFECEFLGSSATLVDPNTLEKMRPEEPIMTADNGTIRIYEMPVKNHRYVMGVDVSKGIEQDFSAFSIIDITEKPYKQVMVYQSNKISYMVYHEVILQYAQKYNNAYMIVENNGASGGVVCKSIYIDSEYENFYVTSTKSYKDLGLFQTQNTKRIGTQNLKELLETNVLQIVDKKTIDELYVFEPQKTSFGARKGHNDDLVMSLCLFAYLTSVDKIFKELELSDKPIDEVIKAIRMAEIAASFIPLPMMGKSDINVWDDEDDVDTHLFQETEIYTFKGWF